MAGNRIVELLQTLIDGTDDGRLVWRTSDTEDWYTYSGAAASVGVGSRDGDGQAPFQFILYNKDGGEADNLVDDDTFAVSVEMKRLIRELYQLARRNARNVDPLAKSLIEEISGGT